MAKEYFPKVKEAREALREKALLLLEKYERIIDAAIDAGQLDVAAIHTQWLLDHMPRGEGSGVIDSSASKPKEVQGPIGPQIAMSIQLGGMTREPKQLDTPIIDVTPLEVKNEEVPTKLADVPRK